MTWQVRKEPRKKESDELLPILMTAYSQARRWSQLPLSQANQPAKLTRRTLEGSPRLVCHVRSCYTAARAGKAELLAPSMMRSLISFLSVSHDGCSELKTAQEPTYCSERSRDQRPCQKTSDPEQWLKPRQARIHGHSPTTRWPGADAAESSIGWQWQSFWRLQPR